MKKLKLSAWATEDVKNPSDLKMKFYTVENDKCKTDKDNNNNNPGGNKRATEETTI